MSRTTTITLSVVVALLILGPLGYAWHVQNDLRNFRVVREGVLYRSGQMTLDGLKRVAHDYGIRTVITLRDSETPGKPPPDQEEERYCRKVEIGYHRITPQRWWSDSGPPPVEAGVRKFLAVLADPRNHPVLVHCFAGVHRTGAYVAVYRMQMEGWSNADAIAEVKACGYKNLDDEWDILGYLEQFKPLAPEETRKTGVGAPPVPAGTVTP